MPRSSFLQSRAQFRVAAVDLVTGDPAHVVSGAQEAFDHRAGQFRLGGHLERLPPLGGIYAVACGHRLIVSVSPHNSR